MSTNDPSLLVYDGRHKFYWKGEKHYACRVKMLNQQRLLRRAFRTATQAEVYGQEVVARWRRLMKAGSAAAPKSEPERVGEPCLE